MPRILGIDPGSRITGYGVIEIEGTKSRYVSSGCIRLTEKNIAGRLGQIHAGIMEVMQTVQADEAAVEQVFFYRNSATALKLGQARGAAIVAIAQHSLSVAEYSAQQIKQSVVGYGAATKDQVQHMVCTLLNLSKSPQADAADALAVALCHANMRSGLAQLTGAKRLRRGRMR